MTPLLRTSLLRTILAVGFFAGLASPGRVQAQAPAPVAAPAAAPGNVVQQSKPFYVEAAVVMLLMGGAIFTVCRGSRR